jgi:dihydroxyacetone kinase-like protein
MCKSSLSINEVRDMMLAVADKVIQAEPVLTDADRALGDGDHGIGMERGMNAVKEALTDVGFASVGKVFAAVGTAMMSSMGGASGALFGTFFKTAGKAVGEAQSLTSQEFALAFQEGTRAVMTRGEAKPGDKTMVDALFPAAEKAAEFSGHPLGEALCAVAGAASAGCDASEGMIATRGRSKTLGRISVGKPDAGAISVSIIVSAMRDYAVAGPHQSTTAP